MIDHIPQLPVFAREVARVLKPGGVFLCDVALQTRLADEWAVRDVGTPDFYKEFNGALQGTRSMSHCSTTSFTKDKDWYRTKNHAAPRDLAIWQRVGGTGVCPQPPAKDYWAHPGDVKNTLAMRGSGTPVSNKISPSSSSSSPSRSPARPHVHAGR